MSKIWESIKASLAIQITLWLLLPIVSFAKWLWPIWRESLIEFLLPRLPESLAHLLDLTISLVGIVLVLLTCIFLLKRRLKECLEHKGVAGTAVHHKLDIDGPRPLSKRDQ